MEPRKTSFVTLLAPNVRRRHEHWRVGKQITGFVVQIELYWQGEWKSVIRYDTAHGFAHKDRISPKGQVDKVPLFVHSFNEALDYAEADLRQNWAIYVERFLKEAGEK